MTVDQKAVADMARIMAALSGESIAEAPVARSAPAAAAAPLTESASHIDPATAAMKDLLLKLQEAGNPTFDRLQETAKADVTLREAMQTERTAKGARIGSWEIVMHEGAQRRYDVVNVATQEPIAANLYLYEAAHGLVKRLNEGVSITDGRIRQLLALEEDFARNRDDAAHFKTQQKRLREKGDDSRAAIAEDRLDESQRRAQEAHENILRLAGIKR